jgi:hypothetical protein
MTQSKAGPICGLLFAVTLIAGVALIELNAPTGSTTSDHALRGYYTQHHQRIEGGAALCGLALFFLIIYANAFAERLVAIAGAIAAVFIGLYGGVAAAIPEAMDYAKPYHIDLGTARLLGVLSFTLTALAGFAAAITVGGAALSGRRTGSLPRWLPNIGVALAVLSVVSSVADAPIGFAVLAIWAILSSVVALTGSRQMSALTTSTQAGANS